MRKYSFKPYSPIFPKLFENEKQRLIINVQNIAAVEHIGSTAVPGLGGKGIIDIAIGAQTGFLELVSEELQKLGYVFKKSGSTAERLFFKTDLADPEEENRICHLHLMIIGSKDWKELLVFRDYLINHPEEAKKYALIKINASKEVKGDGAFYRNLKNPFITDILEKLFQN